MRAPSCSILTSERLRNGPMASISALPKPLRNGSAGSLPVATQRPIVLARNNRLEKPLQVCGDDGPIVLDSAGRKVGESEVGQTLG